MGMQKETGRLLTYEDGAIAGRDQRALEVNLLAPLYLLAEDVPEGPAGVFLLLYHATMQI